MNQIKNHLKSVKALNEIKDEVLEILRNKDSTEKQIADFILKEYKLRKMKSEGKPLIIVSFGKNTADIHHKSKKIKIKQGPIMIDMWAKIKKGCFADFTFMFHKAKPKSEFLKKFKLVVKARNTGIKFIEKCLKKKYLPTFFEIDAVVRAYLAEKYEGYAFLHRIGHSLGKKVHDGGKLEYYDRIKLNKPYTLEPGIYFKNKFGIRLESDFYIDKSFKLHSTKLQNNLIVI